MISRDEAIRSANAALSLLDDRIAKDPAYGVYVHAREQLERMLVELGSPYLLPTPKPSGSTSDSWRRRNWSQPIRT